MSKTNDRTMINKELVCTNCGCPEPKKTYDGYWCKHCHNEMSIKTTEQKKEITMSKESNHVMVSIIISTDNDDFRNFTGSLNKSAVIGTLRRAFDSMTFNQENYTDGEVEKSIYDNNGNWVGKISLEVQESK